MMVRSLRAAFARLFGLDGAGDTKAETGTLSVVPSIRDYDAVPLTAQAGTFALGQQALIGKPVLVSLLLEGKLIQQREMDMGRLGQWVFVFRDLPLGTYSVKFEAPGVETVIKKGLVVTASNEPVVIADLTAGQGVRVVEYGKEGVGLTHLLGRIKELEVALAAIRKGA